MISIVSRALTESRNYLNKERLGCFDQTAALARAPGTISQSGNYHCDRPPSPLPPRVAGQCEAQSAITAVAPHFFHPARFKTFAGNLHVPTGVCPPFGNTERRRR